MRHFLIYISILALATVMLFPTGQSAPAQGQQQNYMLVFELIEYTPEIQDALSTFFDGVFQKGDQLVIASPIRLWGLTPEKLALPKKELINGISGILKKDIATGASKHRSIDRQMLQIVQEVSRSGQSASTSGLEGILEGYIQLRKNKAILRSNQQNKLLKYSKIFRKLKGNNHILMFMQQQLRPIPDRRTMNNLTGSGGSAAFKIRDAFTGESFKNNFDLKEIKAQLQYANARFHFLYLKFKKNRMRRGVQYVDTMGDLYSDFSKLTKATHGVKITSAKPGKFIKKIKRALVEGKVETEVVDQKMEK